MIGAFQLSDIYERMSVVPLTPRFVAAQSIRDIYGHRKRLSNELIDRYYELLLRDGNRDGTRVRFSDRVWVFDESRLKTIEAPTLVMWGGKDPWVFYGTYNSFSVTDSSAIFIETEFQTCAP